MKPAQILRDLHKLPKKLLGQNFLADESVVDDMIEAAEIEPDDVVVEIGPGLGALTDELARRAKQVLAIEDDQELVHYLRLKKRRKVKIIHGDALKVDWTVTLNQKPKPKSQNKGVATATAVGKSEPYRIVANIPYSLTSPLLRKIFGLAKKPTVVVLLIQKEMARRLIAPPGSSERGFLTLLTEAAAKVELVRTVKPGSFYPRPKVDSAIIKVVPLPVNRSEEIFWPAVEAGFRHKRQTLANAISRDLHLAKSAVIALLNGRELKALIRAQELTFADWGKISTDLTPLLTAVVEKPIRTKR